MAAFVASRVAGSVVSSSTIFEGSVCGRHFVMVDFRWEDGGGSLSKQVHLTRIHGGYRRNNHHSMATPLRRGLLGATRSTETNYARCSKDADFVKIDPGRRVAVAAAPGGGGEDSSAGAPGGGQDLAPAAATTVRRRITPSELKVRIRRRAPAAVGNGVDVWLLDTEIRQSLASMRSYSEKGLSVGAAVSGTVPRPPGFSSRRWSIQARIGDFAADQDAYVDALLTLLERHPAQMILPGHDGSIEALRRRRLELERYTALPLADEGALDIAISKERTLALARHLGISVPEGIVASTEDDVRAAAGQIGMPVVIKPVQSWVQTSRSGVRLCSGVATTVDELAAVSRELLDGGNRVIVQEWLSGPREAVTLFYAGGQFLARFAQVSHRERPLLGGTSVFYESIPLLPELVLPAEALVRAMNLEGCAVVEFRRDRAGKPVLMEVNPRMAASVALPIACGVDFPLLTFHWATGRPLPPPVASYVVGRRLRWLAGDIRHLMSAVKHPTHLESGPRSKTLATFATDFFRRPAFFDPFDPRDPFPALVELRDVVGSHLWSLIGTPRRPMPGVSSWE